MPHAEAFHRPYVGSIHPEVSRNPYDGDDAAEGVVAGDRNPSGVVPSCTRNPSEEQVVTMCCHLPHLSTTEGQTMGVEEVALEVVPVVLPCMANHN